MLRALTIGQQIVVGILLPFVFLIMTLTPSSYSNAVAVADANRHVAHIQEVMLRASELLASVKGAQVAAQEYLLAGRDDQAAHYREASELVDRRLGELREQTTDATEQQRLDAIQQAIAGARRELATLVEVRRTQGLPAAVQLMTEGRDKQAAGEVRRLTEAMSSAMSERLKQQNAEFEATARRAVLWTILCVPICIIVMAVAVFLIVRNLNHQIGTAVQHLRSSATELQAAATQQVKGAKGQSATATEVATTMRELVSTSRQIADSAQRVTGIANETTAAARAGDHTVVAAQGAVEQIKHHVDRIVTHMLDLGKRSQEIGSILDIINELAEQTNILAINATIEAAGAGDAGRRFAVVADEIRKLADRVGGSTKEIRGLIEEVRAAANTTVMVTEDGSKAVDASASQFPEVAASFRRIVELVGSTTQASREIELSTKQQTTAVEQASTAIADVAQTARETESSSAQTMQTASQLATLSQQLIKLSGMRG